MSRRLTLPRPRRSARDERGAVAVLVAASMTGLLVITALVMDFGLARIDRQIDRSAADSATLAGLHGLGAVDGVSRPYIGVCTAARYLKANSPRFAGINENTNWKNGLGAATANGCSDATLRNRVCRPTDRTTWARWSGSGTYRGVTVTVTIESGYVLGGGTWAEDTLPATSGDNGDPALQGCDNLAVTITQSRRPGMGSLATSADLRTSVRSVGRVTAGPGDSAPAMLLLKRTGCPVLTTGSSGGGSFIHVLGAVSSDGKTQPGTIHADSDGVGCNGGNNGSIFGGLANDGIVAYAAPLASNPAAADPNKPGSITSVASYNGLTGGAVRDSLNQVYATNALTGTSGSKIEPSGRPLVTRSLVDDRYFPGVKAAVSAASSMFAAGNTGLPLPPAWVLGGWIPLVAADPCKPTQVEITAMNLLPSDKVYVNCTGKFVGSNTGTTINAGTLYFRGWLNPASTLRLPNARKVYVANHGDNSSAISLGNGSSLEIGTAGSVDASGNCATGTSNLRGSLLVRGGDYKQTGGLLRLCRTTAIMMGGRTDGCVPAAAGAAPMATPCAGVNGGLGSGQFTQNGGDVDWTAPNSLDAITDAAGNPTPTAVAAWSSTDGPEDLALWAESGSNTSTNFSMAGGGLFRVQGVFMAPNADPFILSGGANLDLRNAQYIATSVRLNGNTTRVTMSVDPNAAVSVPSLNLVGLVR